MGFLGSYCMSVVMVGGRDRVGGSRKVFSGGSHRDVQLVFSTSMRRAGIPSHTQFIGPCAVAQGWVHPEMSDVIWSLPYDSSRHCLDQWWTSA